MNACFRWIPAVVLTSLLTLLSSCGGGTPGGGGGIGGTGVITIADGLSEGTISGFGSILLNGRRFNTDQAVVRVNNQPASLTDLAVGMTVSAQVNFASNTATRIEYFPAVVGRVESNNGSTISVLGQTVKMSSDGISNGVNLAGVTVGTPLEISGSRDKDDTIIATYITNAPANARTQITGLGDGFSAGNYAQYGGLTIPLDNFGPFPSFTSYEKVQIQGEFLQSAPSGSTFAAENVQVVGGGFGSNGTPIELEGLLIENSAFGFSAGFTVAGRPLILSPATSFQREGGMAISSNTLAAGDRVEVEGKLSFGGAINAERVIVLGSATGQLSGAVENIDPDARTVTVMGMNIYTTERTRFRISGNGGTAQNYSTLHVGDSIDVLITQDQDRLIAASVQTTEPNTGARITGKVTSLGNGFVEVLGVQSAIGIETEFTSAGIDLPHKDSGLPHTLHVGDGVEINWENSPLAESPADRINVLKKQER